MRYLECKGTPREIGRQQGESLRDLIRQRWTGDVHPILVKLQAENPGVTARVAKAHAHTLAYMKSTATDLVEEIEGIGEGAKIPFDQALLLSTYNSLLFSSASGCFVDQLGDLNGCSALAFAQSAVGPFLSKTYDPFGSKEINTETKRREQGVKENRWLFVLRAEYSTGFAMLGVRIAGSIWTECGVNNHGLGFASASLHPRLYPQSAAALPQHCIGTLAINRCADVEEARELMRKTPVFGKGYAMSFADQTGDCVGVEKTAGFTGLNEPRDGVAFQTNHLRSPEMVERGREQDPKFWESNYHRNSSTRVQHIERRLSKWKAEQRLETLVDDLFHAGTAGDLIQNCTEQCQFWITTWGGLVLPARKELWIAEGLPEEKQFQKWKL